MELRKAHEAQLTALRQEASAYHLALQRCQSILHLATLPGSNTTETELLARLRSVLNDPDTEMRMREVDAWILYYSRLKCHEENCERAKPQRAHFSTDTDYAKAKSHWDMKVSMDAPNPPGYYRANND